MFSIRHTVVSRTSDTGLTTWACWRWLLGRLQLKHFNLKYLLQVNVAETALTRRVTLFCLSSTDFQRENLCPIRIQLHSEMNRKMCGRCQVLFLLQQCQSIGNISKRKRLFNMGPFPRTLSHSELCYCFPEPCAIWNRLIYFSRWPGKWLSVPRQLVHYYNSGNIIGKVLIAHPVYNIHSWVRCALYSLYLTININIHDNIEYITYILFMDFICVYHMKHNRVPHIIVLTI